MDGNVNFKCGNDSQDTVQAMSATPLVELIIAIQNALVMLNYQPGRTDGILGPNTRNAICQFQTDNDLVVDGKASYALFNLLYLAKKHCEQQKTPLSQ